MDKRTEASLQKIVDYLWIDEEKNWNELGKPKTNHIFLDTQALQNWLNTPPKLKNRKLIKEIDLWLADYNSLVADMDFDSGTLEGSASQLLIKAKGALLAKPTKK